MSTGFDPYSPVTQILKEIEVRLDSLRVGVTLAALRHHLWREYEAEDPDAATDRSYFQCYLTSQFEGKGRNARVHGVCVQRCLSVLEWAIIACELALMPRPKPLRELLNGARQGCARFDEIMADCEQKRAASKAHRCRGGKARHAVNDCARLRAARLVLVMARSGGWLTEAHAARTIEPRLVAFIKARRLSIVCEDHLRRTIVRWIKNHPAVRAAYLATCTAAA